MSPDRRCAGRVFLCCGEVAVPYPSELTSRLAEVTTLFSDIDDTISTDGKIRRIAYNALWDAQEAGLRVIPVTGRPAGWCDHIARMWPVEAVIGENGGLCFRMTPTGMERIYVQDAATRAANRERLAAIQTEILATVGGCGIASDQGYREFDLAIDFCEDVPALGRPAIRQIVSIFERHGATAKVSSIHVNGWFGDFDKLTMVRRFVQDMDGDAIEESSGKYAFIGDSPNDEPMFSFFPLSFGVANVRRFLPEMQHHPVQIATAEGGEGFAEVVQAVLTARRMNPCAR